MKLIKWIASIILISGIGMIVTGCPSSESPPDPVDPVDPVELDDPVDPYVIERDENFEYSEVERIREPDISDEDVLSQAANNTEFGLNLFRELNGGDENLVFSPYSVSSALAMTWAGAGGETKTDMAETLGFEFENDQDVHASFNALDLKFMSDAGSFDLKIANSVWVKKSLSLNPDFLRIIAEYYGSGIGRLDFGGDRDGSARIINDWISDNTEGLITDVVNPESISGQTLMFLVNAIYFNAEWEWKFEEADTWGQDFELLNGNLVRVPMMHTEWWNYGYFEGENYKALSMPYKGDTMSMLFILPDSGEFETFEEMSGDDLTEIIGNLENMKVEVAIPKFEFRTREYLSAPLKALGMGSAFGGGFSKMFTGGVDGFIASVIHEAYIRVDEEGTEAAAVTVVQIDAAAEPMAEVPEFVADRPFIFAIYEHSTNSILFLGKVIDPR